MDRQIVYPGAIPQDTDLLSTNKNAMVAMGLALLDIFGSSTTVVGFPCTQTTVASLAVQVGAGRIYSYQNVDGTPYGSLAADTSDQIIKQGIQRTSTTLATAAPGTAGQSINYLIEASYQDADSTPVVLPYYNAGNPSVPFSGPTNSGAPQNTQRLGTVVIQAKAGIPATTGSQTTPAPDSGFVPLYVVTVANGQSTVTSANISVAGAAPFTSGSFTATLTGCTTAPTCLVKWSRTGNIVTAIIAGATATSNSTSCSLTGVPANLIPTTIQSFASSAIFNNSTSGTNGGIQVDLAGNFNFTLSGSSTVFTASGTKGLNTAVTISWLVGV